jgi:predicted nicotinamide N-methyase
MVEGNTQFFRSPRRGIDRVEIVKLPGHTFRITRPGDANLLLEDPYVTEAFNRDEFMPYWADLWPASRMLAAAVLANPWPVGTRALEVGCGLGLAGVAGLCAGLDVTLTDYDITALEYAQTNIAANAPPDAQGRCMPLDWRFPPKLEPFPLILAADVVYEERHIAPLVNLITTLLAPDGMCMLSDPNRAGGDRLTRALTNSALSHEKRATAVTDEDGTRHEGTLHFIRHLKK